MVCTGHAKLFELGDVSRSTPPVLSPPSVISTIAPRGIGASLGRDVLQAVPDARGVIVGFQVVSLVYAHGIASEFIRPDLKFLFQFPQHGHRGRGKTAPPSAEDLLNP